MAPDGSFPRELARTKPYGYSLFNLEAMATICQILSTPDDNLWTFELADGRGMRRAMEFMVPYIADKRRGRSRRDVMYDGELADAAGQPALRRRRAEAARTTSISGPRCPPTRTSTKSSATSSSASRCCGWIKGTTAFFWQRKGGCPLFSRMLRTTGDGP